MAANATVVLRLVARNLASKGVRGFSRSIKTAGRELSAFLNSRLTQLVAGGGIALGMRRAFQAADELSRSTRNLSAQAKIAGVPLDFLRGVAQRTAQEFKVSSRQANDLSVGVSRLSSKAGQTGESFRILSDFLELGAARGLTANETLVALEQTILGLDEGTDKLFGKNPSALYEEYAKAIGTSAGKLTEQQKALAIVVAVQRDANKVSGEYSKFLESAAGRQAAFNSKLEDNQAQFGKSLSAVRLLALEIGTALLDKVNAFVNGIQLMAVEMAAFLSNPLAAVKFIAAEVVNLAAQVLNLVSVTRHLPGPLGSAGKAAEVAEQKLKGLTDRLRESAEGDIPENFKEALREQRAEILALAEGADQGSASLDALAESLRNATTESEKLRILRENVTDQPANRGRGIQGPLGSRLRGTTDLQKLGLPERDVQGEALTFFERLRLKISEINNETRRLDELMAERLFETLTSLPEVIGNSFGQAIKGVKSFGEAFVDSMRGGIALVARMFGEFFAAQAIAALGMGAFLGPFGLGKGAGAAALLGAASAAMFTLSAAIGGGGGGGGLGAASTGLSNTASTASSATQRETTIILSGTWAALLDDPQNEREFLRFLESVAGLRRSDVILARGGAR